MWSKSTLFYVEMKADFLCSLGRVSTFLNRCESTSPERQISFHIPRIFRRIRRPKKQKGSPVERLLPPRLMLPTKFKVSKSDDLSRRSVGFCDTILDPSPTIELLLYASSAFSETADRCDDRHRVPSPACHEVSCSSTQAQPHGLNDTRLEEASRIIHFVFSDQERLANWNPVMVSY